MECVFSNDIFIVRYSQLVICHWITTISTRREYESKLSFVVKFLEFCLLKIQILAFIFLNTN
jgi:hypothetical protein